MYLLKSSGRFLNKFAWAMASLTFLGTIIIGITILYLESHLPDVETLKDVHFQQPLRIYSQDKKLIAEFGQKRRIPVRLAEIPKPLIHAILATEDQRFFEHPGVDFLGLVRAAINLAKTGAKSQGASTITMQVARNFFLSRKKTYLRKINEILLAIKIDKELSKEMILELYLNKIYFGQSAYGVAAAAQVYYGKKLQQLTVEQMAMIAGLPKAPSRINPLANAMAAKNRRNHVLDRMLDEGYISVEVHQEAIAEPLSAKYHRRKVELPAHHVAEMIRQLMFEHFGEEAYTRGYKVYTTLVSGKQRAAELAHSQALLDYDKRHGYRGVAGHVNATETIDWSNYPSLDRLQPALVIGVDEDKIRFQLRDGTEQWLALPEMTWARAAKANNGKGPPIRQPSDVVSPGDVIYVLQENDRWQLSQIPEIEGALVSLNPQNGAIEALVGGFDFQKSHYNRITQALRQPGSSFKPFIYSAALANGFTLASIINDAPIVRTDASLDNFLWRPQNHNRTFNGPTRLGMGVIQSRNLVTIRVLDSLGIDNAIEHLEKFGFEKSQLPHTLSLALGSTNLTALELAAAYCVFANGGFQISPHIIHHVTNAKGDLLMETKAKIACPDCQQDEEESGLDTEIAPRVISPQVAYLMNHVLKQVIQVGTARKAKVLKRLDIGGKTGTSNEQIDGWFAGFNSQNVAISWVGFDSPRSTHEYGSQSALPMWIAYMKQVLANTPETQLKEPPGIVRVKIDPQNGLLANGFQKQAIFELFVEDSVPTQKSPHTDQDHLSTEPGQATDYLF